MTELNKKNVLGFGKDTSDLAQPIGISGEENNEIITLSLEEICLFKKILLELKKFNFQLESITNTKLTRTDAESYKNKL